MSKGIYVYGLIPSADTDLKLASKAVLDPEASLLIQPVGDIAAIYSHISTTEIMPVRRNLLGHTRVLEEAMDKTTVVPMQFGVIVPDEAHLARMLEINAAQIRNTFAELKGKIEVGLKVRWNEKTIFAEIAAESPDLQNTGRQLNRKTEQESYYDRIALGQRVEAILEQKKQADCQVFLDKVEPLADGIKLLNTTDEYSVLNSALLINKSSDTDLLDEIMAINSEQDNRFEIKYISPVPAYNFISAQLDIGPRAA